VDDWQVLCFNTESDGETLYKFEPNKGEKGRIQIIFGNTAGHFFMILAKLRDRWADFRYVKFQSGAEHDLSHFKRNGFSDFWGVVDVQTLIMLIRPATKQSGIEFCSQHVWGYDTERYEYHPLFKKVFPRRTRSGSNGQPGSTGSTNLRTGKNFCFNTLAKTF
jgi:hypothetical protein